MMCRRLVTEDRDLLQGTIALLKKYWQVSGLFGMFSIAYVALTVLAVPNASTLHKYHISVGQAHMLGLTVALPYVAIWLVALLGYIRLRAYADALGKSRDGVAMDLITRGVLWFILWLPLSTVLGSICAIVYGGHPNLTASLTRMQIYANLLLLAPGFLYINKGSALLVKLSRSRIVNPTLPWTLGYIAFSVFYTYITLTDTARRIAVDAATPASYYLPDWLIIGTVIIPRLLLWYLGLQAIQNILLYRQKIPGVLYRRALTYLAAGLGGVVAMIILLRFVQSLSNVLSELNLLALLLVLYLLLILMSIGYVLIAKGAKQLHAIEDI